jgi:hypothetical protein
VGFYSIDQVGETFGLADSCVSKNKKPTENYLEQE